MLYAVNNIICISVPSPPKTTTIIKKIQIIKPVLKKVKLPPPKFKGNKKFFPPVFMPKPKPLIQWDKMLPPGKKFIPKGPKLPLPPTKIVSGMYGKVNGFLPPMKGQLKEVFPVGFGIGGDKYGKQMFNNYYMPQKQYGLPPTKVLDQHQGFYGGISNLEKFYPQDVGSFDYFSFGDDWYGKGMVVPSRKSMKVPFGNRMKLPVGQSMNIPIGLPTGKSMQRPYRKSMQRMKPLLPVKLFNKRIIWYKHCFPNLYGDPYAILRMNPHLSLMGLEHIAFEIAHKNGKCL